MFEQKRKWGLREKGKSGRGHKANACMLYNTQTETLSSLLNNAPSSHFIYLSVCFFSENSAAPQPFDSTWKTIACIDILTQLAQLKATFLRGPIVPVKWHYPSLAHSECLGSGRGYRLQLKESKRVH